MKTVNAFGLELTVENWVKFLAIDYNGEMWGYDRAPYILDDFNWIVDESDALCKYYGHIKLKADWKILISEV